MLDLWLPLAMGQRLVIARSAVMKDFNSVRDLISQHQVVGVTGVPSILQVSLAGSALYEAITLLHKCREQDLSTGGNCNISSTVL